MGALAWGPWHGSPGLEALAWRAWRPWPGGPGLEALAWKPWPGGLGERGTDLWTGIQTSGQNISCNLQDIVPLGPLPKKRGG